MTMPDIIKYSLAQGDFVVSVVLTMQADLWHAQFSVRPSKYNLYPKSERLSHRQFFETQEQARRWVEEAAPEAVKRLETRPFNRRIAPPVKNA